MQSRVAVGTAASNLRRVLFPASNGDALRRWSQALPTGRAADPAIHAEDPQGEEVDAAAKAATAEEEADHKSSKESSPFETPKTPFASSPHLSGTPVNQPVDPTTQQKRRNSTTPTTRPIDDVSCAAGFDESSSPDDSEGRRIQRKEQEEDDKEYFEHHKASPLSEIEMADTRKPITRATDGTVDSPYYGGDPQGVIVWRPEQLDTAEEALKRGMEIWKRNATRGDPDSPHGRVLRELRGEYW